MPEMSPLGIDLVFLVMQFLNEEKYKHAVHWLERESGFYFNIKYFEEVVMAGDWHGVENYLSGFTKLEDNRHSMKIFFEIRKQKYLEALDSGDKVKALEILLKDLKPFERVNEDLYKELTHLIPLDNFRENELLSKYGDTVSCRKFMLVDIRKLIEANPVFQDKLVFPIQEASRLRDLINQSLNWQHQLFSNPHPQPNFKTLYTDHICPNGAQAAASLTLPIPAVPRNSSSASLGSYNGLALPPVANANNLEGWPVNPNPHQSVQSAAFASSSLHVTANQDSVVKHSRTPIGLTDFQNIDHEPLMKRFRSGQSSDQVTIFPVPKPSSSVDDLPRTVLCTLQQGFNVTSMDFHPRRHTVLAVGCTNGEISLWDVGKREKLVTKQFHIWNISACSVLFQASSFKDSSIATSRVSWSPGGNFFGVAFTKHLIHLYSTRGQNDLHQIIEIDAHAGCVNDLAFANPKNQICVVTGGDDRLVKVWDLSGKRLFSFEGHDAPVYSVCPRAKNTIPFVLSTALDGKIKAWVYDSEGPRISFDAPGQCCTTMKYSADGRRLFSCGTSKAGDSFLVEWNETDGVIERTYLGLRTQSQGTLQFDLTQNHFLAVGEDFQIKFWDMDNENVLTSVDAEGGLPNLPHLRFNKLGNLLAVTTADHGFKILANAEGLRSVTAIEVTHELSSSAFTSTNQVVSQVAGPRINPAISQVEHTVTEINSLARPTLAFNGADSIPRILETSRSLDDVSERSISWELFEIVDSAQCRVGCMPESLDSKVTHLLYTNKGHAVLALCSNGLQKYFKWSKTEQNPHGRVSASIVPEHYQPRSGALMINVVPQNAEDPVPCMAIAKNDSYVMSSCGGNITIFNITRFEVMTTFLPPPPAPTFLAFHPLDNNIIAVGLEDSIIQIYNVRKQKELHKLRGHVKRVTGLAFSMKLDILVSSGADAQLCSWSAETWKMNKSITLTMPSGKEPVGETRVQFYSDQVRFLVSHETHLAIYDASNMELLIQWTPRYKLSASISCAAYSQTSKLIYAAFADGNIGVFDANTLEVRTRITPAAYLAQASPNSETVRPLAIATHPWELYQFAVGMSDGSVKVIEPSASQGKWGGLKDNVESD